MLESGGRAQRMEVNKNAKVWRFTSEVEAREYLIFLDGHWDHVVMTESFAMRPTRTWVVIAWQPIGSIG